MGANWLRNLAQQLVSDLGQIPELEEEYLNFLLQVLQATFESKGNPQVVYPLLQENLDKLDDTLTQVLHHWASAILTDVEPKQAQDIARSIGEFSNLIQQFPLGSRASNIEIAIIGYKEVAATVFTREASLELWATLQNNLGLAYSNRIREDRAQNLESAIGCYQQALLVRTRTDFPVNWAMTRYNLGAAYRDRIREDQAQNLELAIECYQQALQVYTRTDFPVDEIFSERLLLNGLASARVG